MERAHRLLRSVARLLSVIGPSQYVTALCVPFLLVSSNAWGRNSRTSHGLIVLPSHRKCCCGTLPHLPVITCNPLIPRICVANSRCCIALALNALHHWLQTFWCRSISSCNTTVMYLIHSAYMLLLLLRHSRFCLTLCSPRCFALTPMYNFQWQSRSTRSHRSQGAPPRDSRHTSGWFNHHRLLKAIVSPLAF